MIVEAKCFSGKSLAMNRTVKSVLVRPVACQAVRLVPGPVRSWFALVVLSLVLANELFAQIQIVNCDAPIQSRKRGLGVNSLSDLDFRALAPGVSWYYNWGATPLVKPADVAMDFIPMAWNGQTSFQTQLASYLAAGNRPGRVFALNEPNLAGQAFMTPSNSANTFKQVKAICDPYNIPVIAPHMAIGSASNASITAYDPIQGSNVTYTFQEPFLNAFLYYCGSTPPAGAATHSYGGYGEITWVLSTMHTDYPTQTVWLTEFNTSATSDTTALANLIPSVDYCERTPWVEGYAWFMARLSGNPYNSLLTPTSGVLTPAGQAYLQMPVHSTNIFYRIPGRLQAERYVTMNLMNIAPTTDVNGFADMAASAVGGNVDYNLQVDTPGNYPLSFRAAGNTGLIKVYNGGTLLGAVNVTQAGWSTVSTNIFLAAGPQTLHVVLGANAQRMNWLDFLATNGTPSIPSGLTATAGGSQVVLNWLMSSGATNYNVRYSTTNGGPYTTIASLPTTSYTNSGLALGVTYYYVVSAVNAAGESANSLQVSATTAFPKVNLALNKVVTVSSVESLGYPGTNAVDGSGSTRWSSAFSDPQWIYVDLQSPYAITEVKLNWENAYGRSYQIQVSADGVNWTNTYSTTTGAGGIEDLTGLSGTGRYVRMYGTARATTFGYSLWEFEVYGTVPPPTGLTAIAGNQQVALSWNPSPGATSYNVKNATASGGPYATVANVATSSYTNTGLANGTSCYFVLSALNASSESANSGEASATLTNHTPVLAAISNQTILAGRTLLVTNSASDPDAPPEVLTFSLPGAPAGAVIDTNIGVLTWRPAISQSPSTQTLAVVVSDNGMPPLTATQSFAVTVIQPGNPTLNAPAITNSQFGFTINGDTGPDYTIQVSTNLTSWTPVMTNMSLSLPFFWVDTNYVASPPHFYRVILGP
jgi:fibronectin type 3 domain-containing protein